MPCNFLCPFIPFCTLLFFQLPRLLKRFEKLRRFEKSDSALTASSAASSVCFILGFADAGRVSLTSPSHKQLSSLMRLLAVRK